MRPLPSVLADTSRQWVNRMPPDPRIRIDTDDYSLQPLFVERRVEVRVDQREIRAVVLDTGELGSASHPGVCRAPHAHRN
jgi:hypothetical protein